MDPHRQWLVHACQSYRQSQRVLDHVEAVLSRFSHYLFPKLDSYVHPDGSSSRILCLYGTVSVSFNSSSYNIPMEFWIPEPYPSVAPIVYVRPTQSMAIHPSNDVDANGRVYHPSLHFWDHRTSDLLRTIISLQHSFSLQPPVYSRPSPTGPSSHISPNDSPVYSTTPNIPPTATSSSYSRPPSTLAMPRPIALNGNSAMNPPVPISSTISTTSITTPVPPLPPVSPSSLLHIAPPSTLPPPMDPHAIALAKHRAKVLSQLKPKFQQIWGPIVAEVDTLIQEDRMLNQHQVHLQQVCKVLDVELNDVNSRLLRASKISNEIENLVESWTKRDDPDVNDILLVTNPIQAQLLDVVAEDHAIEDTMYMLGKALDESKIDVPTYLKNIRSLAKDQFLQRALARKCAEQLITSDNHTST